MPFAVSNLVQAVQGLRGLNLGGVSVTIPFKEEIFPLLDEIDEQARTIGAVNTVVNREGRLWGTNTDWQGAVVALQEEINLAGERVLVLGAGGAGRAIVYAVRQAGGEVTVADADDTRARTLAQEFGAVFVPMAQAAQEPAAVLINATPVGMAPREEDIPLDPDLLSNFSVVMDIVYKPLRTAPAPGGRRHAAAGPLTVCRCSSTRAPASLNYLPDVLPPWKSCAERLWQP